MVLDSERNYLSNDFSLVVFGSLARNEWTDKSDLDWGLLINSQADPEHLPVALQISKLFKTLELKEPGRTGVFGNLIFSHELVHQIGGESDPNSNITRRLLLLLESCPIGSPVAYKESLTQSCNAISTRMQICLPLTKHISACQDFC